MGHQEFLKKFIEICARLSEKEMLKLFELFFTIEERETLGSRFLIVKALLEGHLTQREIAETYKVSIAQITRGSNALKMLDHEFEQILKTLFLKKDI